MTRRRTTELPAVTAPAKRRSIGSLAGASGKSDEENERSRAFLSLAGSSCSSSGRGGSTRARPRECEVRRTRRPCGRRRRQLGPTDRAVAVLFAPILGSGVALSTDAVFSIVPDAVPPGNAWSP